MLIINLSLSLRWYASGILLTVPKETDTVSLNPLCWVASSLVLAATEELMLAETYSTVPKRASS